MAEFIVSVPVTTVWRLRLEADSAEQAETLARAMPIPLIQTTAESYGQHADARNVSAVSCEASR